jgi:hypothetical protein
LNEKLTYLLYGQSGDLLAIIDASAPNLRLKVLNQASVDS